MNTEPIRLSPRPYGEEETGENHLMAVSDNPVGRLHAAINSIPPKTRKTVAEALCEIYDIDPEDTASILQKYTDMAILVVEGKKRVANLTGLSEAHTKKYNYPLDKVATALAQHNIRTDTHSFRHSIPTDIMAGLDYTSMTLSRDQGEKVLTQQEINKLFDTIQSLRTEIWSANIDDNLRHKIMGNLDEIEIALRNYRTYGVAGIQKATEAALGGLIVSAQGAEIQQSGSETLRRYVDFLTQFTIITDAGMKIKEIAAPIVNVLLGLPAGDL